jgi:hypothetical protein
MSEEIKLPVEYAYPEVLFPEVGEVNPIIGLIILVVAIAIIEIGDFRIVTVLLGILGALITIEAILEGVFFGVIPLVIYSIVLLPIALFITTAYTKPTEEPPLIHGVPSIGLLLVLVIIVYVISTYLLGIGGIEWALIFIGVFGLLTKTDLRKSVASISILIYSVHLLVPGFDVVIEAMLMFFSSILILILLVLAQRFFVLKGTMSTKDLRDLRY